MVHKGALFLCPGTARGCDELAVVGSAGGCNVASARVGWPILGCWDIVVLVCVPIVDREIEGVAWARVDDDEDSWTMWLLVWVETLVVVCEMAGRGLVWVPEVE